MAKRYGLTGVGGNVELAKDGPRLKDSSGVIEARNSADSAYAIVRVADGSASNDAVNKGQLDAAVASDSFSTIAGDSGTATADSATDTLTISGGDGIDTTASDDPEVLSIAVDVTDVIDTAAGLTETANDIQVNLESDGGIQFDGVNGGLELKPDSTTGATVAPLTVGTNGAGVTVDNSTIDHAAGTIGVADAGVTETQLNSSVAGDGLTGGAGSALAVGAGDGIDVAADSIAVDVTDVIDTAAGLTETANDIQVNLESDGGIQFDGVNGGLELKPDSTTGATVAPLTVGTNGAGVAVDNSTIEHTTGTLSVKDGMQYRKVAFAYDDSSPFNIGDAVPAGATVLGYMVQVDTVFDDGASTLQIGDSGDPDAIATTAQIDLTATGLNSGDVWVEYGSQTQVIGTMSAGTSTQGAGSVLIKFIP